QSAVKRGAAWEALIEITPKTYGSLGGFLGESIDSERERTASILAWRQWWDENSRKSSFEWLLDELSTRDRRAQLFVVSKLESTARVWALGGQPIPSRGSAIAKLRELTAEPKTRAAAVLALAALQDRCVVPELIETFLVEGDSAWDRSKGVGLL